MADQRTLDGRAYGGERRGIERQLERVGGLIDNCPWQVAVSFGTEAADARAVTLQVVDRDGHPWAGRFLLMFYLTTTSTGNPLATGNTVAFTTGTVMSHTHDHGGTVAAGAAPPLLNGAYQVFSDENGKVVFTLTIAGAATRYVRACVLGKADISAPAVWAA